ncbi:ABC transporter substrate-binding protein [Echinicola shivajiensis]|uniref:ABC transporter substrate-binding protein n=1 Tax=Echinicola shivajiensis TaxID=1035916 RepID=UPI001BFBFF85|nr:helical backbone metal receptor [Echinicola shivajiensis]
MEKKLYKDQMGREVKIVKQPSRIISLVPSQTELLIDLGLSDQIVGLTKFCVHPKELKQQKTIIGGTKNFRFNTIRSLQPDLIIGNKEENYKEGIEILEKEFPVWMSDIYDLSNAYEMMESIGEITGSGKAVQNLVGEIKSSFQDLEKIKGSVLYLIWQDPFIGAGQNTFINNMLEMIGFRNVLGGERYPSLQIQDIEDLDPEYILLSSEPFPFKEKHMDFFKDRFPNAKPVLVDGEMFSWYGSRLRYAPVYFNSLKNSLN